MRILALFALVAVASALPRQPTKDFPKKYDASVDGLKDTYGTYNRAPDEDLVVPAENFSLDFLFPPSSYDAYFERQPQDAILPPEPSSYVEVDAQPEGDALSPPPVDTYSAYAGSGHSDLSPPLTPEEQESYVAYEGEGQESLVAPPLSSYAETPTDKSGADVLASLAAMVQSLPQPSSYNTYEPAVEVLEADNAPSLVLLPPSAKAELESEPSSYLELPEEQPALSPEQIKAAEDANIPVPALYLLPPSL